MIYYEKVSSKIIAIRIEAIRDGFSDYYWSGQPIEYHTQIHWVGLPCMAEPTFPEHSAELPLVRCGRARIIRVASHYERGAV